MRLPEETGSLRAKELAKMALHLPLLGESDARAVRETLMGKGVPRAQLEGEEVAVTLHAVLLNLQGRMLEKLVVLELRPSKEEVG